MAAFSAARRGAAHEDRALRSRTGARVSHEETSTPAPARRLRHAGLFAGTFLVAAVALTPVASSNDAEAIDAYLRAAMETSGIPGLAAIVVERGQRVYEGAFGSTVDGSPMTTTSRLIVGSVGKSITALAVRQLAASGAIDLDAPLVRYLPWFTLDAPAGHLEAMTVATLLAHISGLSTADGQDPRWYEPGLTPEGIARSMSSVRPDRPVGAYEYSNLNYVLLGVLIEAASGQPYDAYLADHVFGPLGMASSAARGDAVPPGPTGHRYLFGAPVPVAEPYPDGVVPAGYHVSNADDMARFVAALAAGGAVNGTDIVGGEPAVVPAPALTTDWSPMGAASAGAASGQSGSTIGTNADILVEPGAGRGVVVLMNANPTQLLGLPRGAADIALDVLRLSSGSDPVPGPPTVRTVYAVVDVVLLALAGLLVAHARRARTWTRRWVTADRRGRRAMTVRTVLADLALPLVVLLGFPLLIGLAGSAREFDIVGGWRFTMWTLPDVGVTLLLLATVPLVLGTAKLVAVSRMAQRA